MNTKIISQEWEEWKRTHIRKGDEHMNEREKEILTAIAEALPKMSEKDRGYMLGYAEAMVEKKQQDKKEPELVGE